MEYLIGGLVPCLLAAAFYLGWTIRGVQKKATHAEKAKADPAQTEKEKELQRWARETFSYNVDKALENHRR